MKYTIENVLKYNGYKVNDHNIKLLQEGLQNGKYDLIFTEGFYYNLCQETLKESYELYNDLIELDDIELKNLIKECSDGELHILSTTLREFSPFFFMMDEKSQNLNESETINLIETEWNQIYNYDILTEEEKKKKDKDWIYAAAPTVAYPIIQPIAKGIWNGIKSRIPSAPPSIPSAPVTPPVSGGSAGVIGGATSGGGSAATAATKPGFFQNIGSGLSSIATGAKKFLGTPIGHNMMIGAGIGATAYALRKSSKLADARTKYTEEFMKSKDYNTLSNSDKNAVRAYSMVNNSRIGKGDGILGDNAFGRTVGKFFGQGIGGRIRATHNIKKMIDSEQESRRDEAEHKYNKEYGEAKKDLNNKYKAAKEINKNIIKSNYDGDGLVNKIKRAYAIHKSNMGLDKEKRAERKEKKQEIKNNTGLTQLNKERKDQINNFKNDYKHGSAIIKNDIKATTGNHLIKNFLHPGAKTDNIEHAMASRRNKELQMYKPEPKNNEYKIHSESKPEKKTESKPLYTPHLNPTTNK